MPTTPSPLRYPGGKTKLYKVVKKLIDLNGIDGTYIEPFAGGAGLALKLLFNNDVKRIVINDSDPAIYAFWRSVLDSPGEICEFLNKTPITYKEWEKQKEIYSTPNNNDLLTLGKATLFLNRVNVSGVIKGGVIGGKNQDGEIKMDARFNRGSLVEKIKKISNERERIQLYNLDVLDFMSSEVIGKFRNTFVYFDPPYVSKGGQLYMNYFNEIDHKRLRDVIAKSKRRWIVTYDICNLTAELYKKYRRKEIDLTYSVNGARKAKEYMFFSDNLIIPSYDCDNNLITLL